MTNKDYKYKLSVLAIFKNESHILDEWISHYLNEGVEHFYFIDNDSTDNYQGILEKYKDNVTLFIRKKKHAQVEHYNECFMPLKDETQWISVVDLDEFIYARNGYKTIPEYLDSVPEDVGKISIIWKMFGSSGFIEQPDNVVENFVMRSGKYLEHFGHQKQILRTSVLKSINIHDSKLNDGTKEIKSNGDKFVYQTTNIRNDIENINNHNLHLNHYAIQSYNWFKNVKMTRGSATSIKNDNVRTEYYFKEYDHKNTIDEELKYKRLREKLPEDFDWEFYLNNYSDLKAVFSTENEAITHYLTYGKNEGRTVNGGGYTDVLKNKEEIKQYNRNILINHCNDFKPITKNLNTKYIDEDIVKRKNDNYHSDDDKCLKSEISYKYTLSIGAIFKNESHILNEWIQHYLNEGVEHFYFIDNGSTDNYQTILEKYKDNISLFIDDRSHMQQQHYNNYFLPLLSETKFIGIFDLDEFVYSRNGYNTITSYLSELSDDVGKISITWKMFGSSGFIEQPDNVINNFVMRRDKYHEHVVHQKQILRTKYIKELDIHDSTVFDCKQIKSNNEDFVYQTTNIHNNIEMLNDHNLHLNHYAIQSYNWFREIKMTRGSAATIKNDNVRTEYYFKEYDHKNTIDEELKYKTYDYI